MTNHSQYWYFFLISDSSFDKIPCRRGTNTTPEFGADVNIPHSKRQWIKCLFTE